VYIFHYNILHYVRTHFHQNEILCLLLVNTLVNLVLFLQNQEKFNHIKKKIKFDIL